MGQKKDELGDAIKYLVYQAGKHSAFVDIFGGSGSASVAVAPKNHRMQYVYNEKNRVVYNYFETMTSDDYKKVINAIKWIQNDLYNKEMTVCDYYGFDINEEINKYISWKKENKNYSNSTLKKEEKIRDYGILNITYDSKILGKMMSEFKNEIKRYDKTKFELQIKAYIDSCIDDNLIQEKTYDEFIKISTINDFYTYEDVIFRLFDGFSVFMKQFLREDLVTVDLNTKMTYWEWRQRLRQYKALGYFSYFLMLRNQGGKISANDKIKYAVGEIFLHYFTTQGDIGTSAILGEVKEDYFSNKRNVICNFIYEDFDNLIKEFHKNVKGKKCIHQDFRTVINGCAGLQKISDVNKHDRDIMKEISTKEDIIFYSDSPYVATDDYEDKVNGVSKFSYDKDMPALIKLLMNSGKKIIFSMRAVKTRGMSDSGKEKTSLSKDDYKEISECNKKIYEYVYKEFEKYFQTLSVLVIHKKDADVEHLMRNHKVVEIMITNFPIQPFIIEKKLKTTIHYHHYCSSLAGMAEN